jgi:hypothetical protein
MIVDFDKTYAREVLPVLARQRADDCDPEIVAAHLQSRRVQTPLVSALIIVCAIVGLTAYSLTFADGPFVPPGATGQLVR